MNGRKMSGGGRLIHNQVGSKVVAVVVILVLVVVVVLVVVALSCKTVLLNVEYPVSLVPFSAKKIGAILTSEITNNGFKLHKWTAQSVLAGADVMKLG